MLHLNTVKILAIDHSPNNKKSAADLHFTLVIPTYNRPDDLKRCLDSLFALTHTNWQAIVVNDGSSSSYAALERELEDPRIDSVNLEMNQGVNHARNTALQKVSPESTDYICFIDDDEYFIPDALSIAGEFLVDKPLDWLVLQCFLNGGKTTYMARSGKMDYVNDSLFGKNLKHDATHFIRADLAVKHRFSTRIKNGEEWIFFVALGKSTPIWAEQIPVKHNYHQEQGLSRGGMHGKKLYLNYAMKVYRPFSALLSRPGNLRAQRAFLLQFLKIPLRLLQVGFLYVKQMLT